MAKALIDVLMIIPFNTINPQASRARLRSLPALTATSALA